MNKMFLSLNFGCMKFFTRSYETYRTVFMAHNENKNKKISILSLINNLGFFASSKNTILPFKKDKRRSKKYSLNRKYTKQDTILSYVDSVGPGQPHYNDLFDYHGLLSIYYLFGMFNTGIYTCLESTYNKGEILITGSKLGTYYIQDFIKSSSYQEPVQFIINRQEEIIKIVSNKNNIILLTTSSMSPVISNVEASQFYSNIEELKKLIISKNIKICTSTVTKNISDYISINCKVTKHIIDLHFEKNIFGELLEKSKNIELMTKKPTYFNIDRLALNLYFDISTFTFIIQHSFVLLNFGLGYPLYSTTIKNDIYILVNNKNTVVIKYFIKKHDIQQNKYIVLYQDKLDYDNIKDEKHYISYHDLFQHYKQIIKEKISGKIFS